jgi:hypothetical protein
MSRLWLSCIVIFCSCTAFASDKATQVLEFAFEVCLRNIDDVTKVEEIAKQRSWVSPAESEDLDMMRFQLDALRGRERSRRWVAPLGSVEIARSKDSQYCDVSAGVSPKGIEDLLNVNGEFKFVRSTAGEKSLVTRDVYVTEHPFLKVFLSLEYAKFKREEAGVTLTFRGLQR